VPPRVLPAIVAPRGTLPFGLARQPAADPGAVGARLHPRRARDGERLRHPPDRRLWSRLAGHRVQKAPVLAPRHLGLVDEKAVDADRVTPALVGRALAFRACP